MSDENPIVAYLAGDTIATIRQRAASKIDRSLAQLKAEEAAVLVLIQRGLRRNGAKRPGGVRKRA